MHDELRNKDPVKIKSTAKTASIDNDDNDNDDCDFDSNFDCDSEEEALAISAHTVNSPKEEPKGVFFWYLLLLAGCFLFLVGFKILFFWYCLPKTVSFQTFCFLSLRASQISKRFSF